MSGLVAALIIGAYMILNGILQLVSRAQLARRVDQLERQAAERARRADPARTAELERALGMDLDGLPPFWRTLIRLYREVSRHG